MKLYSLNSFPLLSQTHSTIQLNTMSLTTSKPMAHQYTHEHIDLPLRKLKLLVKNLNICYNWVSFSTHLATGPHLFIRFLKRHQMTGDCVEITQPSIMSPFLTVIPSHTFTIFLLPYMDLLYFLKLISSKLTTKYQYTQTIHQALITAFVA